MSTASEQAKAAGLKTLSEMAEITGESPQILCYRYKTNRQLFRILLLGCVADKAERQKPTASHWYCSYCEQQLNERDVTFNQRHAYCRNVAKWVEVE